MRRIGLRDVFAWSEMFEKIDIIQAITEIQSEAEKMDDPVKFAGVKIMTVIFTKFHYIEKEIIEWISSMTSKSVEEVNALSFKELKEMIKLFFENEELQELFSSLVSSEMS